MSAKTLKKYFITAPNGAIQSIKHSRQDAREYRLPFHEKIVQIEYTVKSDGIIEIINQKQVR